MLAPHSNRHSAYAALYAPASCVDISPEPAQYVAIAVDEEPDEPREQCKAGEHRPLPPALRMARVLGFSLFGIIR